MSSTFLQIFLLLNVFLIGALTAVAIRHAYAHFRPHPHEAEKPHHPAPPKGGHLPPAVRERLLQEAEASFKAVLDHSAEELQHDLKATATQLNKQFEQLGAEVAKGETARYELMLAELRKQSETAISSAQTEISGHQTELKAKLAEKMAAEEQRLVQQIDTKLADAVVSFLTETLQHNVDLGAQSAYLTSQLEEHKDDFKREVGDETSAAK